MNDMGTHSGKDQVVTPEPRHQAAGAPMRRARASAWTVFWLTAGSSVLYNCYHAIVAQHMPWYTGGPEGVVPLVVAIGVLEFSGAWRENKPLQGAAWLVTGGAMAWSAIATNAVVNHGWAFGLIADTAALAAMYFLLNGPTAAQAIARVAAREAELLKRADAERVAREADGRRFRAELDRLRAEAQAAVGKLEAELETARRGAEADRERAEILARKLEKATGSRKPGSRTRKPAATGSAKTPAAVSATGPETADDLDVEASIWGYLQAGYSASEAGRLAGVTDSRGRQIARKLRQRPPVEQGAATAAATDPEAG